MVSVPSAAVIVKSAAKVGVASISAMAITSGRVRVWGTACPRRNVDKMSLLSCNKLL